MTEDTALITQNMGGGTKEVPLLPDCILTDFTLYPRLLEDFNNTGLETRPTRSLTTSTENSRRRLSPTLDRNNWNWQGTPTIPLYWMP